MNSDARSLLAAQAKEAIEFQGGEAAFREHALKHLRVKTVVKESHASPISCLAVNAVDGRRNDRLFATVGKNQATVYDGAHIGENVGLVVQFQNVETDFTSGGELSVCAWVKSDGVTAHEHGDAILAVAGKDTNISIISVAEGSVIRLLKEHKTEVVDLCGCASKPGWLASLSKDGELRVWDVGNECVLGRTMVRDANSLCFSPDGTHLFLGCPRGALQQVALAALSPEESGRKRKAAVGGAELRAEATGMATEHQGVVDCVAFTADGRMASKSMEGRVHVWDMATRSSVATWRVPSCSLGTGAFRSRFGVDPSGAFLAVGNSQGDLYIYDTFTGARVAFYEHLKVAAPMKAAAVTAGGRHVLTVLGNGFIFRYQYMSPVEAAVEEEKEGGGGGAEEEDKENMAVGENGVEEAIAAA